MMNYHQNYCLLSLSCTFPILSWFATIKASLTTNFLEVPPLSGLSLNGTSSPATASPIHSNRSTPRKLVRQKDTSHTINGGELETVS